MELEDIILNPYKNESSKAKHYYENITDIIVLPQGYHEFFVNELHSKVYVYVTDPEKEKITFSIGQPDKHETVEEIVTGEEVKKSGLKPKVAMNAGFFDMCQYYKEDHPELGKMKGEMKIDNNDVEHHGVLIIDGEELETVSKRRDYKVEDGKEVITEKNVYITRVREANTFIKWKKKGEGGYLGPQIDDRANNKLVWEDGVSSNPTWRLIS